MVLAEPIDHPAIHEAAIERLASRAAKAVVR